MFPVEHLKKFEEAGININDPHYGAWWEKTGHRKNAYEYNKEWERFFKSYLEKGTTATLEEIMKQGRLLAEKYGFEIIF